MPYYRFYVVDKEGHINAPAFAADLASDDAAKEHATTVVRTCFDIEIWDGNRRVAVIN